MAKLAATFTLGIKIHFSQLDCSPLAFVLMKVYVFKKTLKGIPRCSSYEDVLKVENPRRKKVFLSF